ncbi:scavenger receptor cysteine-rich type 1 protein M130-like isoform X1 [Sinocyclocheilus anshuiensis]|uniref:scavenger receptor cysteine-rich type 1 protein M130-like isoform X1 n=2 Tax=Sinocyclocheilus anshuiensis TaxID=1608454 RepID=UPI0007BA7D5C|nr:PREDICTED: scavenger receptor cysteine-rich type 1 protein M130-like isoform X1 [Sinocyclocheilus anshuiensis]
MLRLLLDFTLVMVLNDYLVTGDQKEISLVNGLDACSGRVEIHYNGTWATVCGDSWDIDDAAVVCRQLGCGRAVIADGQALFGVGDHHVSWSEVNCKGEESSITQCSPQRNENNCPQSNDAGLICSASSVIIIGAVVTAVLLILSALLIIFLVRKRQKQKKIQISHSKDAVNMQDVLHNNQNEENAEDDYELVDMDDGDHEDVNSDSDQDYVNVDQDDSEPDYINVETDDSEKGYVNVDLTEHRSTLGNNYEDL